MCLHYIDYIVIYTFDTFAVDNYSIALHYTVTVASHMICVVYFDNRNLCLIVG